MAKPTGAKEQSDYGLEVTSATSTSPMYVYHAFPAYRHASKYHVAGFTTPLRPSTRVLRDVGTDTTLYVTWNIGFTSKSAEFEESETGWSTSLNFDTITLPTGQLKKAGADLGPYLWFCVAEGKIFCDSYDTGPNTTEVQAVRLKTESNSPATADAIFGYTKSPHQTAADRLYSPHNFLSSYHLRKLLTSSLAAILLRAGVHVSVPMIGTYA